MGNCSSHVGDWAGALRTARVAEALGHIDPETRAALVLHFYRGLSYREVARALRWSASKVAKRIGVGLERLHNMLGEAWES